MSPAGPHEGGIPRGHQRIVVPVGSRPREESWRGANEAKAENLRHSSLQRRAKTQRLTLRHSAYGYALIDNARKPIDDRNDLSLDEVESWLDRGVEQ